ncbi:MAG TPA: aldehyde dehydrogenase family protein [Candidatus Polarisedimenticolia bacterium]|nr:aldehyde dehydrogenase family protein [Candidatus Polarisedimenticolia bacterium]
MIERRAFIGGEWRATGDVREVRSPATGEVVARVHQAGPEQVELAIRAAVEAEGAAGRLPTWKRSDILRGIAAGIERRRDELTRLLALEAGKPVKAGRAEVDRAVFTFGVAAEEARRLGGEFISMDWAPWGADRVGLTRRFPLGAIAAITPFNFPLNLVAHKLAPCIGAGNTMVLKPASQTPSPALVLAEIAQEAGLPAGVFNVVPASSQAAAPLVEDERLKLITFTGSAAVGWDIKRRAGRKKVVLELGGNAAVIVHKDADLERAADRIVAGGYGYSGQSCISVQRVLAHRDVHASLLKLLAGKVRALRPGDPLDEATDVAAMITTQDAERAASWIEEAMAAGARLVEGGRREGALLHPALLDGVRPEMKVSCREVFAPVVAVASYESLDDAIGMVNDSPYGLQAGIFTRDAPSIWRAFERLEVGGVMVDDVPTYRIDHMPYGGVKESGLGREGLKYAIEDMTEIRLLAWHLPIVSGG